MMAQHEKVSRKGAKPAIANSLHFASFAPLRLCVKFLTSHAIILLDATSDQ